MTQLLTCEKMRSAAQGALNQAFDDTYNNLPDPSRFWPFPQQSGLTDPGHCHSIIEPAQAVIWTPDEQKVKQDIERCMDERITKAPPAPVQSAPQPCGKAAPKGIDFCPAVGGRYLAWLKGD